MTETVADFRARAEEFIAARYPLRNPEVDDDRVDTISRSRDGHHAMTEAARNFQRELFDARLAGSRVPVEYGGLGLTRDHEAALEEILTRYDTPNRRPMGIGIGLALPTILSAGTEEQKQRYVPKILSAEESWCQLFSEPDAGSDLVSLRTKAQLDGEAWVVNGQKVWSSYASDAEYGMLLVRSDPNSEKPHSGITMLILKMDLPGVSVRPLVDITGGLHFNEVFLQDVLVSKDSVLGEPNKGWGVANGTLGGERSSYRGGSGGGRRKRQVLEAVSGTNALSDPTMRQRITSVIADEWIIDLLGERFSAGSVCDGNPAAGSLMKVLVGNLEQRSSELVVDILGLSATAWLQDDWDAAGPNHQINASRQSMIAGGTHQIQRNLLGERVLGLPR